MLDMSSLKINEDIPDEIFTIPVTMSEILQTKDGITRLTPKQETSNWLTELNDEKTTKDALGDSDKVPKPALPPESSGHAKPDAAGNKITSTRTELWGLLVLCAGVLLIGLALFMKRGQHSQKG